MNKTTTQAVVLAQDISNHYYRDYDRVETVLCPPFIDLKSVANVLEFDRSALRLGAQDVYWEESGAYTGAISPAMLVEVGCAYCIVGHSERRGLFGETDRDVNRKVQALLSAGISPVICVGEGAATREAGERPTQEFIAGQLEAAFEGVGASGAARSVVAYEPIWAIGTGRTATPEQAQEICAQIRGRISERYGHATAQAVRLVYGGSVKPENVGFFVQMPDLDGCLAGGAALDAPAFIELVKAFL
jgi:triosephosphate isomerase